MAKLLIFSIRKYGGDLSDANIFSYSPRKGRSPNRSTLEFFERHRVSSINLELNKNFVDYPLANKPICCAHREQESAADVLLFLDTDTVFLGPLNFLSEVRPGEVWVRPVDLSIIGAPADFSGENGSYWQSLYRELGTRRRETVFSTVDQREILEYYNSGMVISSPSNRLFQTWQENFERVMYLGLQPPHGSFFVEQSVLSATIASLDLRVRQLPSTFNYPVHLVEHWAETGSASGELSDKSLLHYHKVFRKPSTARRVRKELATFPAGRSLNKKLREYGVETVYSEYYLQRVALFARRLLGRL